MCRSGALFSFCLTSHWSESNWSFYYQLCDSRRVRHILNRTFWPEWIDHRLNVLRLLWELSDIGTNTYKAFLMCWDLSKYFLWTTIMIVIILWLPLITITIINAIHIFCFSVFMDSSLRSVQGPLIHQKREKPLISVWFSYPHSLQISLKHFFQSENLNRK